MNLPGYLLATLSLLMVAPASVSPEKLSVLLPNQNTEFDLDHELESDPSSTGLNTGLSAPLDLPIPPVSQLPLDGDSVSQLPLDGPPVSQLSLAGPPVSQLSVAGPLVSQFPLAAPPAPLPTGPPASLDIRSNLAGEDNTLQDRVPPVSALYEVPDVNVDPSGSSSQGTCEAQTVVVTSRDVVVSTSVLQVTVPTTVVQRFTTTQVQLQTALQTSYVTLPAIVQTRTVTSVVPETVYLTSTQVQQQVVTSTQLLVQTQLVTSRLTDYVTQTKTNLVYQTVYSTQVQPTYITTTFTDFVTPSCPPHLIPAPATTGYDYPSPTSTSAAYEAAASGDNDGSYYGSSSGNGYKGPAYGPYYHASHYQPLIRRKKLFGGWSFAG